MMKLLLNPLFFLCGLAVLSMLPSCMSIPSGYGGAETPAPARPVPAPKRDITFSLSIYEELGPIESRKLNHNDAVIAIRRKLVASKQFGRVRYERLADRSNHHYHFQIFLTGHERTWVGVVAGVTLTAVPSWHTFIHADYSMSYLVRGKEVYCAASAESVTDIIWLPLIVTSPFMNHSTMNSSNHSAAMDYFINEIKHNNLNSVP